MRKLSILLLFFVLASCERDPMPSSGAGEIVVATSITQGGSTKAVASVADYIGRGTAINGSQDKDFESGDEMVLTTVKRTSSPIDQFTYTNLKFANNDGAWHRVVGEGQKDKIYWSDAENGHTFIGYSLPSSTTDWTNPDGTLVYYGTIGEAGKPDVTQIDFSDNDKIKAEDLLLTYNTAQLSEPGGSVAKLYFYHALANVRVIVNIKGFSPSSTSIDTRSKVSDLYLNNMPIAYKWLQDSAEAKPLDSTESSAPGYGETKTFKTFIPAPDGVGSNVEKVFTFYSLAVPGQTDLEMPFKVTYPDPLNPTVDVTKNYVARISGVDLVAGKCTTISISLNHSNELMTVGASYLEWDFKESPDEGSLRKNSVYLETTDKTLNQKPYVTIVGDDLATEDDAVWLYRVYNEDAEGNRVPAVDANEKPLIKDIYGHEGNSAADAYQISSAQQFLSFLYEVNTAEDSSKDRPVMDFTGKFIKLDAGIYLQLARNSSTLAWPGIYGGEHPFNGTFLGCGRSISLVKGNPLFKSLGADARIENLVLQSYLGIDGGRGAIADVNNGTIVACTVAADVVSTSTSAVGSLVGINNGTIYACSHVGDLSAKGAVGGLAGENNGTIVASFNAGKITTDGGTAQSVCGIASSNGASAVVDYCFFNTKLAGTLKVVPGVPATPADGQSQTSTGMTTTEMQKAAFVTSLNDGLTNHNYSDFHFVHKVTSYPVVESGPVPASGSDPDSGSQP